MKTRTPGFLRADGMSTRGGTEDIVMSDRVGTSNQNSATFTPIAATLLTDQATATPTFTPNTPAPAQSVVESPRLRQPDQAPAASSSTSSSSAQNSPSQAPASGKIASGKNNMVYWIGGAIVLAGVGAFLYYKFA